MYKTNTTFAVEKALELAKANIEKTDRWVEPDEVIDFIEMIYNFLIGEGKTKEDSK